MYIDRAASGSTPALTAEADHELMACLEKSEIYRDYQSAFQVTVGLPLVIQAAGGFQSPSDNAKPVNPFCVLIPAENKSGVASHQLQRWIEGGTRDETAALECYTGLNETAVAIRLGGRVLGFLRTGQVTWRAPCQERFLRILEQMREQQKSLDVPELRLAYFATRVMTKFQYGAVLQLLAIFAKHLATIGNQLMTAQTAEESLPIARARLFIAAHHGEELTLRDVAQAVHMSPFYFCKMFKRETGLTFTVFVARIRVEKVKQSLLHRHMRITEAAFEAGFQSVSQFNRVFRHVVGESPSDYRTRLGDSERTTGILGAPVQAVIY